MTILVLYAFVSAACFYLGSRALITRWLWSRYPSDLAKFMDCAACTGFWWGVQISAVIGGSFDLRPFDMPADSIATHVIIGLCMVVATPIVAGFMQRGLDDLGHAVADDDGNN